MKLQCSCGAKYAFDATPEMLAHPVKFICPSCGLDASEFVNQLIRQEFGGQASAPVPAPAPAFAPIKVTAGAPPSSPPPPPPGRLRISHEAAPTAAAPVAAAAAQATAPASKFCTKHHERATEQCFVCHKPICPKCMQMFGYLCSPLCKAKADAQGMDVPVFEGQRDVADGSFWRKTGLIAGSIGLLIVLFFGLWTWYAWFGSVPHPYFSVRFEDTDRGYSGTAQLAGKDQIVFLHGGTLARYDLKTKKAAWTQELVTKEQVDALIKEQNEAEAKANEGTGYHSHSSADSKERLARQELQAELTLHVSGQNVWVEKRRKLIHYDWDTGKVLREVTLPENEGELVESGDELQIVGLKSVTHISLASGDMRVEEYGPAGAKVVELTQNDAGGGLIGADGSQPLDPKKVEAQAANMKLQGKLALPAIISNQRHEGQLEEALKDDTGKPKSKKGPAIPDDAELFQLVSGESGFVQFSTKLLEERTETRTAMKAPPKKSALDGTVNAAHTGEIANEILNEMQRNAGGDTVSEDVSRYQVTVHIPGTEKSADWTGSVTGSPSLYVLKTVNVIAAGKSVTVLDKSNKKLWEASLTYTVSGGGEGGFRLFSREPSHYGEGPCVEHGDTLYTIDQAVLTSFDLGTGNAKWRLPSVGVVGLFFDDKDNVYVNTTTGNPDDVKYSRQIDLTRNTEEVVSKVEAKTGKTLWTAKPGGFVSYCSGKFLYVIDSYDPNPDDEEQMNDMTASLQKPPYLHIERINPSNGRIMFDYYDRNRCPVNWNFEGNSIQLIFKREVQVLRFITL